VWIVAAPADLARVLHCLSGDDRNPDVRGTRSKVEPPRPGAPSADFDGAAPTHPNPMECMNTTRTEARWKQIKGTLRSEWGDMAKDRSEQVSGRVERLTGVVQEKFELAKDEATNYVNRFLDEIDSRLTQSSN